MKQITAPFGKIKTQAPYAKLYLLNNETESYEIDHAKKNSINLRTHTVVIDGKTRPYNRSIILYKNEYDYMAKNGQFNIEYYSKKNESAVGISILTSPCSEKTESMSINAYQELKSASPKNESQMSM